MTMLRKWKLAIKIGIVAVVMALLKFMIATNSWEFITISSLFLSVVGGTIFILGFILSGTISDFKESERIPVEVANSLRNIYEEGISAKKKNKKFNLDKFKKSILNVIEGFEQDLRNGARKSVEAIAEMDLSEMEKFGASSISRIKSEQSNVRKHCLRSYQIKETSFIPAAYAILEILAAGIIIMLLFTKIGTVYEAIFLTGMVTFFIIYMISLIKDIDDPFEADGSADVDMFLIKELKKELQQ